MSYIGLDVGTSGCKAAIIQENGRIEKSAGMEYSFESPQPGYVELNPATVWSCVQKVLKEIAPYAQGADVLAVSSIGESMVILDKSDSVLYNGIVYLDQRCKDILPQIKKKIDPDHLHSITGVAFNQMFTLNKIIWLRENHPEVLKKADKYFLFGDYITYMLSGERAIDSGTASRTMFFDCIEHTWSSEITNLFNIPIHQFSKITKPGTKLSKIRTTIAEQTGLPKDLEIITGIHDQCSATLGSGSLNPGDVMMGQGSTESINCVIHKSQINHSLIENEICFEPYLDDEHYIIITGNLTHGSSIKWFMNTVFTNGYASSDDYKKANDTCSKDAGNVFFIPYLSKVNLMDSKNLALGGFLGIDVTVTKEQMYRALLEGLCFEARNSVDIFHRLQFSVNNICATGGTSNVSLYMQLKADVINHPLQILQNYQAGIAGLGMICAVANKDYKNYQDATKAFVNIETVYNPNNDYSKKYNNYIKVTECIKSLYSNLDTERD